MRRPSCPAVSISPTWRQSMHDKWMAPSRLTVARLRKAVVRNPMNSLLAHLARGHGELAVPDRAEAADVAVDRHVVGRIGEHELRLLLAHEPGERRRIAGVAADQLWSPSSQSLRAE